MPEYEYIGDYKDSVSAQDVLFRLQELAHDCKCYIELNRESEALFCARECCRISKTIRIIGIENETN